MPFRAPRPSAPRAVASRWWESFNGSFGLALGRDGVADPVRADAPAGRSDVFTARVVP